MEFLDFFFFFFRNRPKTSLIKQKNFCYELKKQKCHQGCLQQHYHFFWLNTQTQSQIITPIPTDDDSLKNSSVEICFVKRRSAWEVSIAKTGKWRRLSRRVCNNVELMKSSNCIYHNKILSMVMKLLTVWKHCVLYQILQPTIANRSARFGSLKFRISINKSLKLAIWSLKLSEVCKFWRSLVE